MVKKITVEKMGIKTKKKAKAFFPFVGNADLLHILDRVLK